MPIVEIPLNRYGLAGELDPGKFKTGYLDTATNVSFASNGKVLQKAPGASRITSSALSGGSIVIAGVHYTATGVTRRSVVANRTKLFKDDGTGAYATTLYTSGGTMDKGQFVEGGAEKASNDNKLFWFHSGALPQVLAADGSSMADIADPPTEWAGSSFPTFGFIFRNSLLAGGTSGDAHRIYASQNENHENFTGNATYTLSVFPKLGTKVATGLSALGRGFLFKAGRGICVINDASTDSTLWHTLMINSTIGIPDTPHAAISMDESSVAFMNTAGEIMLMQESSGSLTGVEFINLTKSLNLPSSVGTPINLAYVDRAQLIWLSRDKQLQVNYYAPTLTPGVLLAKRVVYDFNYETVRVSVIDKDIATAIWPQYDTADGEVPVLWYGDATSHIWRTDPTIFTNAGTPYGIYVASYMSDFSDVNPEFAKRKLFYRLHMEYLPSTSPLNLSVGTEIDGKAYGFVDFDLTTSGFVVSDPSLNVVPQSAEQKVYRRSRDIAGEGVYFRVLFTDGVTGNNPRIGRMWVEFEPTEMAR